MVRLLPDTFCTVSCCWPGEEKGESGSAPPFLGGAVLHPHTGAQRVRPCSSCGSCRNPLEAAGWRKDPPCAGQDTPGLDTPSPACSTATAPVPHHVLVPKRGR